MISDAMQAAMQEAQQSTCVRRQVGAVLLDPVGTIRGRGHNTERGGRCVNDCPRGHLSYEKVPAGSPYSNCIADHAEIVALEQTEHRHSLYGWTMVVTCEPCSDCRKVLDAAKVHVVYAEALV